MQAFIDYFESVPNYYRTALLVSGLVAFWLIEGAVPLIPLNYNRRRHAVLNLILTLFQLLIAVTAGLLVVKTAQHAVQHRWGLLQIGPLPPVWQIIGGVLLLDFFTGYLIHRLQHRFSWMWCFHVIHHTDRQVDVSTALRHHPVETLFRFVAQWTAVVVGGIPIGVVFLYQIIAVFFAQLTHANVRTPQPVDRAVSWIFVTPNMHKVHHHFEKPLTDTNYGNVFSFWDRLLGTFAEVAPGELQYGIDSRSATEADSKLSALLALPFRSEVSSADEEPSAN